MTIELWCALGYSAVVLTLFALTKVIYRKTEQPDEESGP